MRSRRVPRPKARPGRAGTPGPANQGSSAAGRGPWPRGEILLPETRRRRKWGARPCPGQSTENVESQSLRCGAADLIPWRDLRRRTARARESILGDEVQDLRACLDRAADGAADLADADTPPVRHGDLARRDA